MEREVACFYPGLPTEDLLKTLIACFDAVAIVIPSGEAPSIPDTRGAWGDRNAAIFEAALAKMDFEGRPWEQAALRIASAVVGEHIVVPLVEQGLLHLVQIPESAQVQAMMMRVSAAIHADAFTSSVMRGLAAMALETQLLRGIGSMPGAVPVPTTDLPEVVHALGRILGAAGIPTTGDLVVADSETIGADLGGVPLDEILDYRREQTEVFRVYRRALRRCVREVSSLPESERDSALGDRSEEIRDLAAALRRAAEIAWKKPAGVGLGAAGSLWTAASGDLVGAAIAAAGLLLAAGAEPPLSSGPFSYILELPGSHSGGAQTATWRQGMAEQWKRALSQSTLGGA